MNRNRHLSTKENQKVRIYRKDGSLKKEYTAPTHTLHTQPHIVPNQRAQNATHKRAFRIKNGRKVYTEGLAV